MTKPSLDPATCPHENFRASVNVHRMRKGDEGPIKVFLAEMAIICDGCGTPLHFLGVPVGVQYDKPSCGVDGTVVRLACLPIGTELDPDHGLPGYLITPDSQKVPS